MMQVLELGILVHSVIIVVSLGASVRPSTIRPLVGALGFHQFFEGTGLGSCIGQVYAFDLNTRLYLIDKKSICFYTSTC
jgi:hypothetical protein